MADIVIDLLTREKTNAVNAVTVTTKRIAQLKAEADRLTQTLPALQAKVDEVTKLLAQQAPAPATPAPTPAPTGPTGATAPAPATPAPATPAPATPAPATPAPAAMAAK